MADDLRKPDAYESEFMGDDDDVVHRHKLTMAPWFRWFVSLAVTVGLGAGLYNSLQAGDTGSAAMLVAMIPLMLFMITMTSSMRVAVTRDHVDVHYGPLGPKIPIDDIEHVEAEEYQVWKYGGYGIRYSLIEGAWCYNMVGDKGKAVRIHYRNAAGKLKKVLIATPRPNVLADAINRVRISKGHDVPAELAPDDEALGLDEYSDLQGDDVVFETEIEPEVVTEAEPELAEIGRS